MLLTANTGQLSLTGNAEGINVAPRSQPVVTPLLDALGLSHEPSEDRSEDPAWVDSQAGIVDQARRLADDHPDSPIALARLAQACRNAGRLDEAVAAARRALAATAVTDGDENAAGPDATATYVASSVLAAQGHLDDAEEALSLRATDGLHRLLWAAVAAERDDVETALERLNGVQGADAQSLLGWLLLRRGQFAQAVRAFRSATNAGGPSPAVLMNLAYAYASLGSADKAIRAGQQAVSLSPASIDMSHRLVGHLINFGRLHQAERELDRLAGLLGHEDADAILLRATIALRGGSDDDALRVLRKGRSRLRPDGNERAYAELLANLAYFEWRTGVRTRNQAVDAVRRVARRADGISVAVVCLLADLLSATTAALEIRDQIRKAAEHHDQDALLPALAREAHLSADFDRELAIAKDWTRSYPLDGTAAAAYVHLLGQVQGAYSEAGDEGLEAMRRTPQSAGLRNNTAYVLAMAGRGQEALEVIAPLRGDGYVPLATEGVALLSAGHVAEGCRRYREAVDAIDELDDAEQTARLRALVGENMRLAVAWLGIEDDVRRCGGWLPTVRPDDWSTDPQFLLISRLEERLRSGDG
jgi:tetratricopeptide (TPR) repeat protein